MRHIDLGHLVVVDTNPLTLPSSDEKFKILERSIGNFLFLRETLLKQPRATDADGDITIELPTPLLVLPRAYPPPIPKSEKPLTKWQAFAKKKGIKPKRKRSSHQFDAGSNEWRPIHGAKSAKNDLTADWLQELN